MAVRSICYRAKTQLRHLALRQFAAVTGFDHLPITTSRVFLLDAVLKIKIDALTAAQANLRT